MQSELLLHLMASEAMMVTVESLVGSLHNNFGDGYYEEEERLYHPRVAMLKNTNIESELR